MRVGLPRSATRIDRRMVPRGPHEYGPSDRAQRDNALNYKGSPHGAPYLNEHPHPPTAARALWCEATVADLLEFWTPDLVMIPTVCYCPSPAGGGALIEPLGVEHVAPIWSCGSSGRPRA